LLQDVIHGSVIQQRKVDSGRAAHRFSRTCGYMRTFPAEIGSARTGSVPNSDALPASEHCADESGPHQASAKECCHAVKASDPCGASQLFERLFDGMP
jgi:hypothetical protein